MIRAAMAGLAMLIQGAGITIVQAQYSTPTSNDRLSASGTTRSGKEVGPAPVEPGHYTLDRGDRLQLKFYQRPDLSGDYRVSEEGKLRIPTLGHFDVGNRSATDVERELRGALERLTNERAFVAVDVVEHRPFFVAGLVQKPGSYPYVPRMTVIHAVALAGGLYRVEPGSWRDLIEARSDLVEALSTLKRQLAERARLQAELEGKDAIDVPPELVKLAGKLAATHLISLENDVLQRRNTAKLRDEAALEASITFNQAEIAALQAQAAKIAEQREIREKQVANYQTLVRRGILNKPRLVDTQMAASLLARDNQETIASISQAQRTLEKNRRDLAMLTLERKVAVDQEIRALDKAMLKNRAIIDGACRLIERLSGVPASALKFDMPEPSVTFELVRRDSGGAPQHIMAHENTPMLPGDVLRVSPTESLDSRENECSAGIHY